MNREGWLTALADGHLWPLIASKGGTRPERVRISVGFPKGSRGGKHGHAIGQCWPDSASADKHAEIFISPELAGLRAADVLLHELIHAALPGAKHGPAFKRLATACGLGGKMTATVATPELETQLRAMCDTLPAYPHAPMAAGLGGKTAGPGSRMLKACCDACGYTVRTTAKWIAVAVPTCPNDGCERCGCDMDVSP